MFKDRDADRTFGFDSNWKQTRSVKTGECQTDPLKVEEVEVQSKYYENAEVQTVEWKDNDKEPPREFMADPKFFKFLNRAAPMLEAELAAALRSRAFDGYRLMEEEMETSVRKLHTLDFSEDVSVSARGFHDKP